LTTTFRFSLGTLFEPDFDPECDPRLDVLFAVAELLDGVLFTPSSLRDARGRILFGAGGEDAEDPDAGWPRVAAEVAASRPAGAAVAGPGGRAGHEGGGAEAAGGGSQTRRAAGSGAGGPPGAGPDGRHRAGDPRTGHRKPGSGRDVPRPARLGARPRPRRRVR